MPLAVNWPLSFDRPEWLWLLLVIPVLAAVSVRSLAGLTPGRRLLAIALRSLVIVALSLALARIEWVKRNDNVAVLFVLDRSKSIPDELRLKGEKYIKDVAKAADRDDKFAVVSFDGEADVDVIPSRGGAEALTFGTAVQPDRTNIAAGVRMAMAAFPEGYARRVVILTDGNQNAGDLAAEVDTAIANGVAVDVVPLDYRHDQEILFDRISVPAQAARDTRIPVRLIAKSTRPTRGRLTLYHNDQEVPLDESSRIVSLTGGMKPDRFDIPIELKHGGVHRFDARIAPLDGNTDSIAENNKATGFTFVQDQGRVLILTAVGSQDEVPLRAALEREKIDVEMRGIDAYREGINLLSLQEFSTVILSNLSADEFNGEQHKALASYVRDFGGGIIMTGGENGFGAGGWIGKPIEEVSPVSFEIKHKKVLPRGALVIVMHSCEIAKGNYWGQQVAIASVKTISSMDYLGVLSYSYNPGGPHWDVPLAPATDKNKVVRAITQMQNGDMPDFDTTLRIAVNDLSKLKDASQRHIIVISDGDPAPPSAGVMKAMRDNKITCSTVGIGYGQHVVEKTLRDLATQTSLPNQPASFYRCTNPNLLPQIFIKESKIVRRSLLQEEPFRPQLVIPMDQTMLGVSEAEVPSLHGMVLTTPKPDAIIPLIRRTKDGNDPVLAYWNFELGKMATFTSGYWQNWGRDWAESWAKYGKVWAQLVRWSMRQSGSADFDIVTRLDGPKGKLSIEAVNKDASYLNFLKFRGKLARPGGEVVDLLPVQVGPGQYEATFDVNDNGNYLISLQYTDPNNQSGLITTGLSLPYSPEFRELGANRPLLEGVVRKAGGRLLAMDPKLDDVFSRNLPPSVSRQPVWRWVVQWVLLPLFLLDVAGRRLASTLAMSIYVEVAVFVTLCATLYTAHAPAWAYVLALVLAEAVGWMIRWRYILPTIQYFTYGVTAMARAGQRSTQSLSQLKNVREKVREEIDTQQQLVRPPESYRERETIPLESAPDPRRRFDVGDKTAAQPAKDLTETVGGAVAEPERAGGKRAGQAGSPGDLTSRLMKAKKRAQEELKDRGEQT